MTSYDAGIYLMTQLAPEMLDIRTPNHPMITGSTNSQLQVATLSRLLCYRLSRV